MARRICTYRVCMLFDVTRDDKIDVYPYQRLHMVNIAIFVMMSYHYCSFAQQVRGHIALSKTKKPQVH